jgi:hypothetical protein
LLSLYFICKVPDIRQSPDFGYWPFIGFADPVVGGNKLIGGDECELGGVGWRLERFWNFDFRILILGMWGLKVEVGQSGSQ